MTLIYAGRSKEGAAGMNEFVMKIDGLQKERANSGRKGKSRRRKRELFRKMLILKGLRNIKLIKKQKEGYFHSKKKVMLNKAEGL